MDGNEINLEIINQICRVCLSKSNKLNDLYKFKKIEKKSIKLCNILLELFSVQCAEDDGFPSKICQGCMTTLCRAFALKQKCLESENTLRFQIELIDDKQEIKKEFEENNVTNPVEVNCNEVKLSNVKVETEILNEANTSQMEKSNTEDKVITSKQKQSKKLIEDEETIPIKRKYKKRICKPPKCPFKCSICPDSFRKLGEFDQHMETIHNHTYLCNECGTEYKTRKAYNGHMMIHNTHKPHECNVCGKKFAQTASLKKHMFSHTGEVKYLCGICGKGTLQRDVLKKHMLIHTGEKPHQCETCGKYFRFRSNLFMHKRSHTGEKPYKCEVCQRCFAGQDLLKRHSLIHTGEKPYSCQYCGKSFNRQSTLRTHRKIHTGDKSHVCTVCGKGFIQAHCLKSHMNTHNNQENV